jgi:hypothetical protein
MSTGYNRRACTRCGNPHYRKPEHDTCLNCAPVAPCKNCGARRIVETITEECAKCDRRGQVRYEEKRKAARQKEREKSAARYAKNRKTGGQHRVAYTDVERKARLVCKVCFDIPHARPLKGCPKCKRPHGEIRVTNSAPVLGSSLGAVCKVGL